MKKEIKTHPKYLTESTFEKHMRSIAHSFEAQNKILVEHGEILVKHGKMLAEHGEVLGRYEGILELILKEIKALREDYKKTNDTLSGFVSDVSRHDRKINNLTVRVEKLEVE